MTGDATRTVSTVVDIGLPIMIIATITFKDDFGKIKATVDPLVFMREGKPLERDLQLTMKRDAIISAVMDKVREVKDLSQQQKTAALNALNVKLDEIFAPVTAKKGKTTTGTG